MDELEINQRSVVASRLSAGTSEDRLGEIHDPEALLYYQQALERELEEVRQRLRHATGALTPQT